MREERGHLQGDQVITEPLDLWASVIGNVRVEEGGKLYVRGNIHGNLVVARGGRVHVFGNVSGRLTVEKGAKIIFSGVLGGDAINEGGRLYIDDTATIMGRVKTKAGETQIHPKAKVKE